MKIIRIISLLTSISWIIFLFIDKIVAIWLIFLNLILHHTYLILSGKIRIRKNAVAIIAQLSGSLLAYSVGFATVFYFVDQTSFKIALGLLFLSIVTIVLARLARIVEDKRK